MQKSGLRGAPAGPRSRGQGAVAGALLTRSHGFRLPRRLLLLEILNRFHRGNPKVVCPPLQGWVGVLLFGFLLFLSKHTKALRAAAPEALRALGCSGGSAGCPGEAGSPSPHGEAGPRDTGVRRPPAHPRAISKDPQTSALGFPDGPRNSRLSAVCRRGGLGGAGAGTGDTGAEAGAEERAGAGTEHRPPRGPHGHLRGLQGHLRGRTVTSGAAWPPRGAARTPRGTENRSPQGAARPPRAATGPPVLRTEEGQGMGLCEGEQ